MSRLGPSNDPLRQTSPFGATDGDGSATTSKRTRSALTDELTPYTTDTTTSRRSPFNDPLRQTVPFNPRAGIAAARSPTTRQPFGGGIENSTLIPGSYFRTLEGIAVDTDGQPLEEAKYIVAMGDLPTVGPVADDGTFSVYTLRSSYDDFVLVANSGRRGVDYTWYTPIDVEVGPTDDNVVLVFEPRKLNGLFAGMSTNMGGSLR